jgi:transcriptional regulator with XRE-family HTH domain
MNFSEKLTRLRKIKGMTQEEFASAVGVTRQAVYKWESGKSYPEVMTLLEIKNLFGISIDDLLDEKFEIELPKKTRRKSVIKENGEVEFKVNEEAFESKTFEKTEVLAVATEEKKAENTFAKEEKTEAPKEKKRSLFGRLFGRK